MILILLDRDNGCLPESKRGVILSTIYSNCPRSITLVEITVNVTSNNTDQRIIGETHILHICNNRPMTGADY